MKKVFGSILLSIFRYDKLATKKIFTLFFIFLNIGLASSQTDLSDFYIDTTLQVSKRAICGYNPGSFQSPFLRIASAGSPSPAAMPKNTYPASAIFDCGKFRLYYEDLALVSGTGFDAGGGVGAMRRNTLCAVYQYVQTIFDFSNISAADPITIEIQATPTSGSVTYLASAGPVFPGSAGTPGIYNGSVLNHSLPPYTSPAPALFDGTLVVNFNTYPFYSDLAVIIPNCQYDLFSVCLHEVGHQLGFLSLLTEDGGFNPISSFGSDQYTLFDWQNIWHGDIATATFEKIVTGTLAAPQINTAIVSPANYLRDERLWLNDNGRFLDNLPIYSGTYWPSYATAGLINLSPGSVASHLDGEYLSFTQRFSQSPGFRKPHSMQPYFDFGETRREFTEQEIRIFLQLGYLLNPVYATSLSINGTTQNQLIINNNRTPYTTKPVTSGNAPSTAEMSYPDLVQTADFPPMVNNGAPLIINLALDGTIQDLDAGDIIRVEDNTIYNIRGCGNGGNNHNQITVDITGTIITFIPRPNFIGRAQFGFYLHDGKERGSFMIYTIDVIPGLAFANTPNINTPLGNPELIVNGDFEEGTEVRRKNNGVLDESILNTNITLGREEGLYYGGDEFADAHPLQCTSWLFTSGNGVIIGNLFKECFQPVTPVRFGHPAFSFPHPLWNNPLPVTGNRYAYIRNNHNYNTLSEPLQQCRRYVATFDVNFVNTGLAVGSVYTFNLDVTSTINFPTAPSLQTTPVNIIVGAGWQTIIVPFTYCSATPGNFLNFVGSGVKVYYDNVSLIEDPSPTPPLNVSITNSLPTYCAGSGSSSTLTATVTNGLCAVTYSWMPGGATTASIIVSPATTTTYTLTVDDGCRNTVSNTTVTVTPFPVATFSYSGTPYCQNASNPLPTFSGGGVAGTFSSTAGLVFVSTSTGEVNLSASTSGTYTVTNSIAASGGCPAVVANTTITITPLPIGTFSYTGSPYCQNAVNPSPTFSGGGVAGTFSSTAGLVFVSTSTGEVNLSASTPGTYTVTNTIGASGGCPTVLANATITITTLPVATFSYTGSPYCTTDPDPSPTYSGGGGPGTYTSTVGLSINSTNGIVDLSLSTPGTYTVTNTIAASGGCPTVTATATITINTCIILCTGCINTLDALAPGGILSVSPTQYNVYCLNSDITISGTVTIALSEIRIAPGVTITVSPSSTLNIYGSHLYSCTDMWQGIVVKPGGRINVIYYGAIVTPGPGLTKRSPLIEDARIAIDIQAGSTITTGYIFNVSNATFNRNEYAIKINGYTPTILAYPFLFENSVFTCRDIPFTPSSINWPLTNTVKATYAVPTPLQTPYINTTTFSESNAASYLKPPFIPFPSPLASKSQVAIALNGVGAVAFIGATPSAWYEIKIGANGAPKYNVFDNHVICIDAVNSNFTCVNNVFQNTIGTNNGGGIAINATAKQINCRAQVIAGTPTGLFNNKFFDCNRGINTSNYFENTFKYCDVRSTQFASMSNQRGKDGFYVVTNRFRVVNMSDNKFYNIENAVTFNAIFGVYNINGVYVSPSTGGQYSGQVNVDRNEIAPHLPTYTIVNEFVRSAIVLGNSISSSIQVIPGNTVTSSNNNISKVHKGILTTSWFRKNIITNSNIITLVTDPFSGTAAQYGVQHTNNSGATTYGSTINGNSVTGTGIFTNPNVRGIYTARCNDERVACNVVNATTHGIQFASGHLNTKFDNNSMSNHMYGYVLSNNGIIGLQGSLSSPADNAWSGAWTGLNFKTATLSSSSAQFSKMYVRNGGLFNPNGSGYAASGFYGVEDYFYSGTLGTLLYVPTTTPPSLGCAIIVGGGGGGGMPGSAIALLEDIAQDNISHANNDAETKYINKNQLYRLLKADPSLTSSSVVLQNFYIASIPTVRETFTNIEDDIASGDLINGQSKTNALSPVNSIEDNYKTFFNAYLKYQTDTILSGDSIAIVNMANACPFTDGDVVYQARVLYNSIYRTNIYFEDNCPEVSERSFDQIKDKTTSSFNVLLYPNPNTGDFSLVPFSSDITELNIRVIDVNGRIVYEKTIDSADRIFNFNLDSPNGIYMVVVSNPVTNENIVKRIVIQK